MDDFASFWESYPNKVGKLKAQHAWIKAIKIGTLAQMLAALAWQKQSRQWRQGYIPNPATYLNQGRWMDEPPVTSRGLRSLDRRCEEPPCPICGYPEPRYHSQVECNRLWLEQQKRVTEAEA